MVHMQFKKFSQKLENVLYNGNAAEYKFNYIIWAMRCTRERNATTFDAVNQVHELQQCS